MHCTASHRLLLSMLCCCPVVILYRNLIEAPPACTRTLITYPVFSSQEFDFEQITQLKPKIKPKTMRPNPFGIVHLHTHTLVDCVGFSISSLFIPTFIHSSGSSVFIIGHNNFPSFFRYFKCVSLCVSLCCARSYCAYSLHCTM